MFGINEHDQNKMIVSQVDIGQGVVIDVFFQDFSLSSTKTMPKLDE